MPRATSGGKPSKSTNTAKPAASKPASAKSNTNVRHVVPDKKAGDYKVKEPGRTAPTGAGSTQKKAETVAKKQVAEAGGGQVVVHRPDGRIRDADTVSPGNESKTKDKKH